MMSNVYGTDGVGDAIFDGLVKVRLVHAYGASLIVPDQVFLDDPQVWFMPCTFMPNILVKGDDGIHCDLWCDLADGQTLGIRFSASDHVREMPDGSHLYRCKVQGAPGLASTLTGTWRMQRESPQLLLHHHTHEAAHTGIRTAEEFWSSAWNIQGTRKLSNVSYVYFTSLEAIRDADDLAAIAMSPNRVLHFLRDGARHPGFLPPDWKKTPLALDVFEAEVYWSEPEKRDHKVSVWVDAHLIAPHHVLRHDTDTVWFEVSCPAILRVGVESGATLKFDDGGFLADQAFKNFDYMVIGDATTVDGLGAPLDEENSSQKFKIHRTPEPPLEFWFNNANMDHYTPLDVPEQEFEPVDES